MTKANGPETALRRKLSPASAAVESMGGGAVLRALALALARAAQDLAGLALSVSGQQQTAPDLDGVEQAARAQTGGLIALVEADADGPAGLVVLSAPLVTAIVAQRMTGRLPTAPPPPRAPTRADAELLRDVIDAVLGGAEGAADWLRGFRYRAMLSDARLARFALADGPFHAVRLDVALPAPFAEAEIYLALPAVATAAQAAEGPLPWAQALEACVLGAEIPVQAILSRLHLSLTQVSGWQVGDMIALPRRDLDAVRLETAGQVVVATGRLGQSRGDRAVRIAAAMPGAPGNSAAPEIAAAPIATGAAEDVA